MIWRPLVLTGAGMPLNQWVLLANPLNGVIRTPTFSQIQPDIGGSASMSVIGPDHANPT